MEPHVHATYQISVAIGGSLQLGVARGAAVKPRAHLSIVSPGEAHWIADCGPRPPGVQWFALYVPCDLMDEATRRVWGRPVMPRFDEHVFAARADREVMLALHARLFELDAAQHVSARELVVETLARFLRARACNALTLVPQRTPASTPAGLLADAHELTVDELLRKLNVPGSRATRYRAWRRQFEITPAKWRNSAMVDLAKRLLLTGADCTEAALASGFHDQAHLSRTLRRYAMCSPARFGASLRSERQPSF
ncbi:MAG: helix-turn-helix domain-containing protein [Polyangiales bacterium]